MRLLYIVAALVLLQTVCAFEISLDRQTYMVCIRFRRSSTDEWGYLPPGAVTQQTGAYLCRSFLPGSVTGSVLSNDCFFYQSLQYDNTLDCPYNATNDGNCTVGGGGTSTVTTGYTNSILCIVTPTWSTSSGFAVTAEYMSATGAYGTSTGRTVTGTSAVTINQIRPHATFTAGTVCIPNGTSTVSNAIAQAMCRTASLPASLNSAMSIGSMSASGIPSLISNVQCPSTPTATLWNGECSYDTHYYDTPQWCSPTLPVVRCPATFHITLGEPMPDLKGFQLVKLRPQGSNGGYDGGMCLDYDYTLVPNFGGVMCREMYGDDIDFTAVQSVSYGSVSSGPFLSLKDSILSVSCASTNATKLAHCVGTTGVPVQEPFYSSTRRCDRWATVSCKMNVMNMYFSLSDGEAGKGYLQVGVFVTGQSAVGVCSNGFNQDAAMAACRSVGYTPGSLATFISTAAEGTAHGVNNVSCAPGANTLHDCKLRYSGRNNVLSHTDGQVCSGRVYLDCDIGTPSIEFRRTTGRHLQARITPTSEWGWVSVGYGVSAREAYDTMCSKVTSTTADETITKTYLTVSYCPSGATSLTDCIIQYTNGDYDYNGVYCSSYYDSTDRGGGDTEVILGFSIGLPLGVVLLIVFCVYVKKKNEAIQEAAAATVAARAANGANNTNNDDDGTVVEMATVHLPTTGTDADLYYDQHPVMGTTYTDPPPDQPYTLGVPEPLGAATANGPYGLPRPYGCGMYQ